MCTANGDSQYDEEEGVAGGCPYAMMTKTITMRCDILKLRLAGQNSAKNREPKIPPGIRVEIKHVVLYVGQGRSKYCPSLI